MFESSIMNSIWCRSDCFSGQYEELCVSKTRLEQQILQAELEIRELRYCIRQRDETIKVNRVLQDQLRDHIKKLEGRLGNEVEGRETAELKVREYAVEERTKKLSYQQLQEEEQLLKDQLQAEVDARQLQEGLYHEQVRLLRGYDEYGNNTAPVETTRATTTAASDIAMTPATQDYAMIYGEEIQLRG